MSDTDRSKQERFVLVNEAGQRLTEPLPNEEIVKKLPKLQEDAGDEKVYKRQILEE